MIHSFLENNPELSSRVYNIEQPYKYWCKYYAQIGWNLQ